MWGLTVPQHSDQPRRFRRDSGCHRCQVLRCYYDAQDADGDLARAVERVRWATG